MWSTHRLPGRIALTVGLVSLVAGTAVVLTGCTADPRIALIEKEVVDQAVQTVPDLVGLRVGDVAAALKEAGDSSRVMVPVLAPDFSTADGGPTAAADTGTPPATGSESVVRALAPTGAAAWSDWLLANPDSVDYVETRIPVTVVGDGDDTSVDVDADAIKAFGKELQKVNTELFARTVEASAAWKRAMVTLAPDFVPEVTGLSYRDRSLAKVQVTGVDVATGQVQATITYPDAREVDKYRAQQAIKTYGTKKIWGAVSREAFEAVMGQMTVSAADVEASQTVAVSVLLERCTAVGRADVPACAGKETAHPDVTDANSSAVQCNPLRPVFDCLEELARSTYTKAVEGSFTAPSGVEQARAAAVDTGIKALGKQVIKKQARPGTKILKGGKSGVSVTINTGSGSDRHVTFFKWKSSKIVASAFIRAGKSLTMRVPVGSYRLVYAEGSSWYGSRYSFGPAGSYQQFKETWDASGPMKVVLRGNHRYTVTIEGASSGGGGGLASGQTDNPFDQ